MIRFLKMWVVMMVSVWLIACSDDDPEPNTILDVATDNGNFTTLLAALDAADLTDTADDADATLTLFAPTDDAFDLLGDETINALLADPETLADILLYHVISGSAVDSVAAIDAAGSQVEMANGDSVGLSLDGSNLLVNLSMVTMVDIEADNGIIHVIDRVLIPPTDAGTPTQSITEIAAADDQFSTLVAALGAASLDTVLADEGSTFTVFAPTNAAFDALGSANVTALLGDVDNLSTILLQHVVSDASVNSVAAYTLNGTEVTTTSTNDVNIYIDSDRSLRVGGAQVTTADIYATNGVIHVIDTVIVGEAGLPKPAENIAEVATAAGNFTTLLAALGATGLDATLTDDSGSFTVFAPTDDAFDALGTDTINALLADTATLSDILLYHVISGAEVLADGAIQAATSGMGSVEMANTDTAELTLGDDGLMINSSTITAANIMASNGVIHVIDVVMTPPE